ncbi:LOW QUALITY PROTEIN: hypothetical protein PHMEG_00014467 [Phytophthora megakarya]|uniref:Uncharacterized protein n=1 Tax=Phytophthora megakarya TaxID=4795 RepID=A0A225W4S6_9STRA|nr:LOW QUALITY PROTEIN: hypothetical protein PHMEG_00014467 [Phytophthora megakarya]
MNFHLSFVACGVLRGSKNAWHTDPNMNFHLSFVACVQVVSMYHLFLYYLVNGYTTLCDIYGAAVTTTNKAFMAVSLFAK